MADSEEKLRRLVSVFGRVCEFSLVDTGLLVHWLVSPNSLLCTCIRELSEKIKYSIIQYDYRK